MVSVDVKHHVYLLTYLLTYYRDGTLFLPGVDAPHVYVRTLELGCFHSLISSQTFRRAAASMDSCAEIKGAPSVA